MSPVPALLVTCEHGGNRVPREHRALFELETDATETHDLAAPGSALSEQLAAWLERSRVSGRDRFIERLLHMPWPRDLAPAMSPELEVVALRCLGLRRNGDTLAAAPAFDGPDAVVEALAPLV